MTEQLLTAMYLEDPIGDLMIAGNSLSQSLLSLLPSCRCQVPLTLQPATTSRRPHVLFQNEHSAGGLIGACLEGVEIDAAGNGLSDLVCAVPIGCGFSAQIARRFLHAEIQLPHQLPLDVVNAKSDIGFARQVIRQLGFRVKRIREVLEQGCVLNPTQRCHSQPKRLNGEGRCAKIFYAIIDIRRRAVTMGVSGTVYQHTMRRDNDRVGAHSDRKAEVEIFVSVGGHDLSPRLPDAVNTCKAIGGTRCRCGFLGSGGPNDGDVPSDGDTGSEVIAFPSVYSTQFRLLFPGGSVRHKDIGGADIFLAPAS